MIVSHANRFIFFHNPKCAGTSFRDALKLYHDDGFNFWDIFHAPYFKNHIDHTHLRLWEIQAQFPHLFRCAESYNSVIFVRSAHARFLSAGTSTSRSSSRRSISRRHPASSHPNGQPGGKRRRVHGRGAVASRAAEPVGSAPQSLAYRPDAGARIARRGRVRARVLCRTTSPICGPTGGWHPSPRSRWRRPRKAALGFDRHPGERAASADRLQGLHPDHVG